jgi:hypothetical protein
MPETSGRVNGRKILKACVVGSLAITQQGSAHVRYNLLTRLAKLGSLLPVTGTATQEEEENVAVAC